jgi:hypothetical protein
MYAAAPPHLLALWPWHFFLPCMLTDGMSHAHPTLLRPFRLRRNPTTKNKGNFCLTRLQRRVIASIPQQSQQARRCRRAR